MSATPLIGRNAYITMAGTVIGFAQGVTANISMDIIKEYAIGSNLPQILAGGLLTFKITCAKMLIDTSMATQVLGQTPVSFVIGPAGSTTGKPKITLSGVVLNGWNYKSDQKGVVLEDVAGEGTGITLGVF